MTTEAPPPLPTPPAELPPLHALRKLTGAFKEDQRSVDQKGQDVVTVRTPKNTKRMVMPKYLLRMHSSVMAGELQKPRVRVIRVDAEDRVLVKLLRFMHTSRVEQWDDDERALFEQAVHYEIAPLRNLCVRQICRKLTTANFFSTVDFTLRRCKDAALWRRLLDFGVKNFDQLLVLPEWAAFFEQQPSLCRAMIKRAPYHE
ncbi:hypothetical protein M3Y99_00815400 [Aphelenchoides fujianensis]|nr:hypothetical protein M3Y99_00815400 [Aphelenchoides fujianensis]